MIKQYQSHSLTSLAREFASQKSQKASSDPLKPDWVIVQNNEIKEWLSLQCANKKGIAGNFKFIFPSEFLWTLYRLVRDDIPKSLPSDLNAMQWALFDILNNEPDLVQHLPMSKGGQDPGFQLFYLSAQVADIFDQYQVYRPEMMQTWLDNKTTSNHPDEPWQSALWRRLNEYWNSDEVTSVIPSRSEAYDQLIDWISEGDSHLVNALPSTLNVFGLSQQTRPFINIISHLAKQIDVHIFHRNISAESSSEKTTLFESWGNSVQEQHKLLTELSRKAGADLITEEVEDTYPDLPHIALNSCHSIRREVEVLKDSVLHYLNNNAEAGPQDILVMVPDADEYASMLESIFLEEEPQLPISKLYRDQQYQAHALVAILDILNTSFKPSAVLAILNLNPLKEAFRFSDDELDILENWVSENHMYRGVGESYSILHSWRKGVTQLLSGLSMQAESLTLYKGMIPQKGIHSSDDMRLIARFSLFIHKLMSAAEETQTERKPLEWLQFVEQLIHDLLEADTGQSDTSSLFLHLGKLKEQVDFSSGINKVSFGLIKGWLKSQFENNKSSSGRFGQGITVSSYVPYRSIPFRFIAVLGMNEGVFPRRTIHPDFDLIYAQPKPGDRIQKEDDSYLFLETLFAARDQLHISYRGQDQRKDAEQLPSTLVQQLKEVCSDQEMENRKHSLHGFSSKYFRGKEHTRSFSKSTKEAAQNILLHTGNSEPFVDEQFMQSDLNGINQVAVNDLLLFFGHSSKYILQNYLQISDKLYLSEITDREPFGLDGLGTYHLSDFLLENMSAGFSKDRMYNYARSSALVPDKLSGEKVFEDQYQQVKELKETIDEMASAEPIHADIQVELEGLEIIGRIPGIHENTLVISRIGRRKPIHEMEQWLKHLLLLESGYQIDKSVFISKEKSEIEVHELISREISKATLTSYIQWFLREGPVLSKAAFFPETSKKYAEVYLKEGNEEKALAKARGEWEGAYHRTFVESTDYFNKLLWRDRDPLSMPSFKDHAISFWEPLLAVQEASNNGE